MDELIKLVSQKTGLPADKGKVAVDTVINLLNTEAATQHGWTN